MLEAGGIIGSFALLLLPERAFRILSNLLYRINRRHREIARSNLMLTRLIPPSEISFFIKRVYENFLIEFRELLKFLFFPGRVLKKCRFNEEAYDGGQRIFFSAHLSNWELMTYAHGSLKGKLAIVGKKLKNPYTDRMLTFIRKRGNVEVVNPDAPLKIMRLIRKGYSIGFLIDQYPVGEKSCEVTFLGAKTRCTTAPARLSIITGIPLQAGFIRRKGGLFEITYGRVITPHGKTAEEIMNEATGIIEEEIRKRPEEYLWFHRRWR